MKKKSLPPCPLVFLLLCLSLAAIPFLRCTDHNAQESDAEHFDRVARELFKEVYPTLAEQILDDYGITEGICLDLGCGPGYLSIEIAKRSDLKLIGIDIDPEAVEMAERNIEQEHLENRMTVELGDVHDLRFEDNCADLIVSRGSFIFWDNVGRGMKEAYRVLKPGGVAFIGGGMGRAITPEKKEAIKAVLEAEGLLDRCRNMMSPVTMMETLERVDIRTYRIMGDGPGDSGCRCGMWVEIRKPNV